MSSDESSFEDQSEGSSADNASCCSIERTVEYSNPNDYHPSNVEEDQHLSRLLETTYHSFMVGKSLEKKLVFEVFLEVDMSKFKDMLVQHWLPHVPDTKRKVFAKFTRTLFLLEAFTMLQYFVFGFEQAVNDREKNRDSHLVDYKDIKDKCVDLVDEFKRILNLFKITNYSLLQSAIMPRNYREVKFRTLRSLRDYVILTQFNKSCSFICKGLCYIRYRF